MRVLVACAAVFVSLSSAAQGQQPGTASPASPTPLGPPPIIVYRIDLVPNGSMFAANEPVLDGDNWVFIALPEKTEMRLPKVKVKSVGRWSTDYSKEVVWQVDLAGTSGVHLARNEPVKKGKNWVAYTWKNKTLVSVPETDVVKITRLTGREAFKAEQLALGLVVLEGESMTSGFKGGNAPVNVPALPVRRRRRAIRRGPGTGPTRANPVRTTATPPQAERSPSRAIPRWFRRRADGISPQSGGIPSGAPGLSGSAAS